METINVAIAIVVFLAMLAVGLDLTPQDFRRVVRHQAPAFTLRNSSSFRRVSMVGVAGLVMLIVSQGASSFAGNWAEASRASALFVLTSMALGYGVGAAYNLEARDRLTLLIEFGVRNSALPTLMAVLFLHQFDVAVIVTIYFLTQVPLVLLVLLVSRTIPALGYVAIPGETKS